MAQDTPAPPASESCPGTGSLHATIVTSMGELHAALYEASVPRTVANFVALAMGTVEWTPPAAAPSFGDLSGAKKGWTGGGAATVDGPEKVRRPLYSGTIIHRVIPEFMIQLGCPKGNGTGNPGWKFADEFVRSLRHDAPGTLSMANSGPNSNGSQFFVTEVPTPHLDDKHTVFGRVTAESVELVKKMARVPTAARDRPKTDIVLEEIRIFRK